MLTQTDDPTNTELLKRCSQGESHAWLLMVQRYGRLVHSVPARYGLSRGEVEDVGQEVFLALAQQLERIEDPERLGGWLLTTARRISWRAIQRQRQEQPDIVADLAESDRPEAKLVGQSPMPTYAELVATWDRQAVQQTAMGHLGERCRDLLTLIFLDADEPSYAEISAQLEMPKGSIGPTRNRCLSQLRMILEGLGISGSE